MKKQKMNMKGIISLGYLFMAIIILVNYIGKKGDRVAAHSGLPGSVLDRNVVSLKAELDEERRINREMRQMLSQVQHALKNAPAQKNGASSEPASYNVEELLHKGLPELQVSFLKASASVSPFKPGKNPYVPFYARKSQAEAPMNSMMSTNVSGMVVRSDPNIPFLLRGKWFKAELLEQPLHGEKN